MTTEEQRLGGLPRRDLEGGLALVEASTHTARRRGLARMEPMDPSHALHLPGCRSIHTFGMRFALDLIWLRRNGEVLRVDREVAPRRMKMCLRAGSVIETVGGNADAFLSAGVGASPAREA